MEAPNAEQRALAAFCGSLPRLREQAAAGYWADRLDMHVEEVEAGGSALAACAELGLVTDERGYTMRGDGNLAAASVDWLRAASVVGDYGCPLGRCARRATRDDAGRPPRCDLTGERMRFRSA
ncbi:hypothetical protein [Actinokineospora bangkokensis]|uniref:Uncharacterized protein n=1 Tax=Actinokineospora bangkokensis TaxID=1193682 RepID=A0A1Q9LNJ8_9PSEU|nr:hypothetical protein [Actinokineospora bangkokensis]OLR93569.1 hypothetical protein BJP25_14880 [Actinokineospora bangkokensis]